MDCQDSTTETVNDEELSGAKRSGTDEGSGKSRPKKKRRNSGSSGPKNAIMHINEYRKGLEYIEQQSGSIHQPLFIMKLKVDDVEYSGEATSKKKAKLNCAENAMIVLGPVFEKEQVELDKIRAEKVEKAAQDRAARLERLEKERAERGDQPDEGKKETEKKGKREKREPKEPKEVSELSKNPIQALNELRPGVITFEMINERGDSHNKMFTFEVEVDKKKFSASGRNKKLAKANAARTVLKELFKLDYGEVLVGDESSKHSREADENSMWEEIRDLVLDEDEQDKAACTFLNEYFPALAYTLEKKDHEDGKFEYQATVDVEGKQFVSTGRSKRIAKSNVASVALKTLNEDGSLNDKRHEREEKRLRGGRTAGKGGGGRGNRGNSQRGFGMRSGFMQAPVPSLFGGTLGGQASFIRGGRGMRFRPRGTRGIRGSIRGAASSSDTFNNGFRGGSGRRGGQRGRGQAQDMDNNIKHGDSSYFTVNKPYNDDPTRPSANPSYPASNMNIQRNNDYSNMHKPSGYQQEVNRRNYNPTFNAGSQNMNMGGSNAPMGGNSGGNNPGSFSNQNPNYGGGFSQQQKPGMYGNQQQSFNNGGNNFNFNTRNQNMPFQANPNTGNQPPPPHFNPNVAPPPFNSGNPSFVNQTFGNNSNHGNNPNLGSNPNHGNNPNQGNNPNLGSNPSHGNNRNLGNNTNYGNNPNLGNNPNPNFGNSTGNDQGMASGFNNSANNGFSSGPTNMGTQGSMGNAMNTNMGRSDGWNNSQHNNPEMYQQSPAMAGNFAAHGPPMYSGGAPQHGQHNMSGYDMNMQAQGNNHY